MATDEHGHKLLNIAEAAMELRLSSPTVRRMIGEGTLPVVQAGGPATPSGSAAPTSTSCSSRRPEGTSRLDLEDSDTGREAWRSVKANRVGLSIGYLTERSHKDADGVTVLDSIDLFEISIVPAPANAGTRILATKALDDLDRMVADDWKAITDAFKTAPRRRPEAEGGPARSRVEASATRPDREL
jgi:hypothetical protein